MSSEPPSPEKTNPKDCFSCRLVSTLTLTGVGIHALRQTRPAAPGSRISKQILGVIGIGLLGLGLMKGIPLIQEVSGGDTKSAIHS